MIKVNRKALLKISPLILLLFVVGCGVYTLAHKNLARSMLNGGLVEPGKHMCQKYKGLKISLWWAGVKTSLQGTASFFEILIENNSN